MSCSVAAKHKRERIYSIAFISILLIVTVGCEQDFLQPKDFLTPPKIIDPRVEFGHLQTVTITVPASADIFLADSEDGVVLEYLAGGQKDTSPENSPVEVLANVLEGGETLDIYATGEARHLSLPSINFGPKGWANRIEVGPALKYHSFIGPIGALVGLFSNQREPFVIGQRKKVTVPRGARSLYLAVLDYPGASSDNEGEYYVSIDVIRR